MLTDAKQEDERKRDTLYKFYEDTEVCLNSMDATILRLLEQNVTNYKDKNRLAQNEFRAEGIHCTCCRWVTTYLHF